MIEILVYAFLIIGLTFNLLASIALLRFPDVYTRLHGGTKCTTFGSIFLCGSVIIYNLREWFLTSSPSPLIMSIHTFIALIAILITNPTGAHAIARAAHRSGIMPARAVVDDLKKDREGER